MLCLPAHLRVSTAASRGQPPTGTRHPPRGRPSATPTASNAGPQGRTLWDRCSRPHRPHPGHTGRGTLAARSRGRAAGGGTAPDYRGPSQQWQANPPGDGRPSPPRHTAPTGHAGQEDSVGPPHPYTGAHSTWVADPNGPPSRRAVGGGTAPDLRRPSQWWKAPPPGDALPPPPQRATPARKGARCGTGAGSPRPHRQRPGHWVTKHWLPAPEDGRPGEGQRLTPGAPHNRGMHPPWGTPIGHPHSEQRRPARAHAVGPVLGPHARTDRTRDTRAAEPWLPAPEDGQPVERQRLNPGAPHNGGRPTPPGTAPHHPCSTQPPQGMQAKGTVLGPHTHTPAPTAHGWRTPTAGPAGGQSGEGQRLTSDAPHNGGRHPPRGRPSATPTASNAGPQGRTLWDRCWVPTPAPTATGTPGHGTLAARSRGQAAGGGTAPDTRRPSQRWQAPPPGTPLRQPHSKQRRPARAHAMGLVPGPHARTDRTRDTRVAEPWLSAPEDGRLGEGQRLTPGAPRNGDRPAPRGWPPTNPAARSPHRACRPRGQCSAPTPTHPRPQHVGGGPQQPAQWAGSRGRDSA